MWKTKFPSLTFAAALFAALPTLAQTTGGIAGQVVDATSQAPIKDAVIIAQSPALQGEQTAVTDEKGQFEVSLLPTGVYTLTVQREGYQPFSQQGLKIALDRSIRVKLQVVPDSFNGPAIEIVGTTPTIAVTSTTTGNTVSKEQMNLVPYGRNARGFEQVATSVPGVHADLFGFSMNGSGSPEQNFIIDGVNVTNPAFGTQGTTLIQDFVQEVDIKTGGYQAEYGRATGGIINVVTKSGGNEFHGSVFINWSPFEATRKQVGILSSSLSSQVKQNYNLDFGAELGGPIIKDKLWFFAGFAPQLLSNNVDRIISRQTDNGQGLAARDGSGNVLYNELARKTYTATNTSYQFTGKLTYLLNENHNVAFAVYGNPNTTTGIPTGFVNGNEGAVLADLQGGSTDFSLRYSGKLLNKSMLVEATAAYHREINRTNVVGLGGLSAAQLRDTPNVSWRQTHNLLEFNTDPTAPDYQKGAAVTSGCALAANGFNPCPVTNFNSGGFGFLPEQTLNRIAGVLKLSNFVELAGHHQFKYGIDASRDTYDQDKFYSGGAAIRALSASSAFGTPVTQFQYFRGFGHENTSAPGTPAFAANNGTNGILRLAGDAVSTSTKNVSIAAFAQDTWSVFDKVVLDLGIRLEKQMMYADQATLDANGNPVSGAQISLTNVMPRIGLIYDFTQRGLSKVYASFGRFYEYIPLDLADRALSAETQVNLRTNPSNCKDPADPRTCAVITGAGGAGRTYNFVGGAAGTSVDQNLEGQYADEYQAGVQYQIYRDISVGVDFVHKSLGRVIEDMSVDDGTTYFLSNPGEPGKLGYQAVTGSGTVVNEPKPRRIYDGITLSANKNFSENWLLTASYTYSSFRGNYPGLFRSENGQIDPNILSEYDLVSLLPNKEGPLPGDIPNAFKLDTAYVIEVSPTLSVNVGGNLRAQQGQPINYLGAHPLYGASEAFILPRGSAGRLPWNWTLNLRAAAQYKLTKDYNLALSVDVFNATNNQQTTAVDQNYTFDSVAPIVNGRVTDLAYLKNAASGAPVTKNANFLVPTAYQLPLSARLGAKLSF